MGYATFFLAVPERPWRFAHYVFIRRLTARRSAGLIGFRPGLALRRPSFSSCAPFSLRAPSIAAICRSIRCFSNFSRVSADSSGFPT